MNNTKIHIYEENINLLWIVLGLVATISGAYLLADAFFTNTLQWISFRQIGSLILFVIGFYSIIQLTEPLYHFILYLEDEILKIEIWEGNELHKGTKEVPIYNINEVKTIRHSPRKEGEALFDFATDYHLVYRNSKEEVYQELITLSQQSFTLKLNDIKKIIRFIQQHNHSMKIVESFMLPG